MRGPARFWDEEILADIMKACIIMHNMVIEDEGDIGNNDFDGSNANPPVQVSHAYTPELEDFMQTHYQIRDSVTHSQLPVKSYRAFVATTWRLITSINFKLKLYFQFQILFHVVF